jgi:hypothetical protein
MREMKNCDNCIWGDQCHQETPCEWFSPLSEEGEDELAEDEYAIDVCERYALYQKQIDEQDS